MYQGGEGGDLPRASGKDAQRILNRHRELMANMIVPSLVVPGLPIDTLHARQYKEFVRRIVLHAIGTCRPGLSAEERADLWDQYDELDSGGFHEGVPQHAVLHVIGWARDNVGREDETFVPFVTTRGVLNDEERDVAVRIITRVTGATKHGDTVLKESSIVQSAATLFIGGHVKTWEAIGAYPELLVRTERVVDGQTVAYGVPILPIGKISKRIKEAHNTNYVALPSEGALFQASAHPVPSFALPPVRGRSTNPPSADSMVATLVLPSLRSIRQVIAKADLLRDAVAAPQAATRRAPARASSRRPPPSPAAAPRVARAPTPQPAPEPEPAAEAHPEPPPRPATPPAEAPPAARPKRAAPPPDADGKRARRAVSLGCRTTGGLLGYVQDRYAEADPSRDLPTGPVRAFLERAAGLPADQALAAADETFGRWAPLALAWFAYAWPATVETATGPMHLGYPSAGGGPGRRAPDGLAELTATLWGDYVDGVASTRRCAAAAFDRMGVAEFSALCADGFGPYALAICYPNAEPAAGGIRW